MRRIKNGLGMFGALLAVPVFADKLEYFEYSPSGTEIIVSRTEYAEKLHGFWLAQCIANWTGLTTEMDRVEAPFYTDNDWGEPDQKNVWGKLGPSETIDFFLVKEGEVWGSDDDTDIEYMYQHLLDTNSTSILSGEQIRDGWLKHIWSDDFGKDGENYLWVSNETAFELMRKGTLPPETSNPTLNSDYEMIDAQLTTEIFGLFAPARPDVALRMARLPIMTTARQNAKWASDFYVCMYSNASLVDPALSMKDRVLWMAEQSRESLPNGSVVANMHDFVLGFYQADSEDWEAARDALYEEFQLGGRAGYEYKQPFDAGINFGASMVSLLFGEGDLKRTIQIGSLAGWDSDNPTATWGGMLGFMIGREGVENVFGSDNLSETYFIHRTRRGFPDRTPNLSGEDTFPLMAQRGLAIVDRVVIEEMGGGVDLVKGLWYIPKKSAK